MRATGALTSIEACRSPTVGGVCFGRDRARAEVELAGVGGGDARLGLAVDCDPVGADERGSSRGFRRRRGRGDRSGGAGDGDLDARRRTSTGTPTSRAKRGGAFARGAHPLVEEREERGAQRRGRWRRPRTAASQSMLRRGPSTRRATSGAPSVQATSALEARARPRRRGRRGGGRRGRRGSRRTRRTRRRAAPAPRRSPPSAAQVTARATGPARATRRAEPPPRAARARGARRLRARGTRRGRGAARA